MSLSQITSLVLILIATSAYGLPKEIEIDSRIMFQGQKVASPRIVTRTGEKSKVIMNDQKRHREYSLEVFPIRLGHEKIGLRYSIAIRDKENETFSRGFIKLPKEEDGLISIDKGKIKIHLKVKNS